jgi:hypothetical protein
MSYDIQLYRIETKDKEQELNDIHFFENVQNLVPFTNEQFEELKKRLIVYDYVLHAENDNGLAFSHEDYSITALLTENCLYFSSSFDEDSIFEAGMAASEFTDTGSFAKYDPQNEGWEEI